MPIEDFAEFIAKEVKGKTVVEIGVGFQPKVALKLRDMGYEVTVTDWNEAAVKNARVLGLNAVMDDVFSPRLEVYQKADALYSVRPTPEMIPPLIRLGNVLRKTVFILPFSGDPVPPSTRLVNHNGLAIYVYKPPTK